MTNQRYLPADISAVWRYPEDVFVVRYLDMNEAARRKFAQVIRYWATQRRLREKPIEEIERVIAEINPIMLSSRTSNIGSRRGNPFSQAKSFWPWHMRLLTKTLYRLLCTKTKRVHIGDSLQLTALNDSESWNIVTSINNAFSITEPNEAPVLPNPEDITMEDLKNMNRNNQNRLHAVPPDEAIGIMLDPPANTMATMQRINRIIGTYPNALINDDFGT